VHPLRVVGVRVELPANNPVLLLREEDGLDSAGIEIPDEQEDEVEKFREFLDNVSPEDFAADS
jgi:hypothetical protein